MKLILLIGVICCACVCYGEAEENPNNGSAIVGGHSAFIHDYPFMVSMIIVIVKKDVILCDGTILSAKYVLTAGHCLHVDGLIHDIIASIGSTYAMEGTIFHTKNYIVHDRYSFISNGIGADYDVGIVIFVSPFLLKLDGKTSRAVTLAAGSTFLPRGTTVIILGWGKVSKNSPSERSPGLNEVKLPIVDQNKCQFNLKMRLPDRDICAGLSYHAGGVCGGDSGSPAILPGGVQVGIVSAFKGCGVAGVPVVMTEVAAVRPWITKITGL